MAKRTLEEWSTYQDFKAQLRRGNIHFINIVIRRNGKDEIYQGDWLKEVPNLEEAAKQAVAEIRWRPNDPGPHK